MWTYRQPHDLRSVVTQLFCRMRTEYPGLLMVGRVEWNSNSHQLVSAEHRGDSISGKGHVSHLMDLTVVAVDGKPNVRVSRVTVR